LSYCPKFSAATTAVLNDFNTIVQD